ADHGEGRQPRRHEQEGLQDHPAPRHRHVARRRPGAAPRGEPPLERPERTAEPGYHTNGTRRCRTRFWYSVYPARSLARRRSSSRSRQIRNGIMTAIGTSPQYEPSASGVPTRYSDPLAYIGWRTIAYGPVEMTV